MNAVVTAVLEKPSFVCFAEVTAQRKQHGIQSNLACRVPQVRSRPAPALSPLLLWVGSYQPHLATASAPAAAKATLQKRADTPKRQKICGFLGFPKALQTQTCCLLQWTADRTTHRKAFHPLTDLFYERHHFAFSHSILHLELNKSHLALPPDFCSPC